MDNEMEWTADDLRASVERGEAIPALAEYVIASMERDGHRTLGEHLGYAEGIIAEWAAAQPGGVEVEGRSVKPIEVADAIADAVAEKAVEDE